MTVFAEKPHYPELREISSDPEVSIRKFQLRRNSKK